MDINPLNQTDTYYQEHFAGLNLIGEWIRSKEFEDCRFEHCRFTGCNFFECAFLDCSFADCLFSTTELPTCSLIGIHFTDCKLIGLDWTQASNLRGLTISKSTLDYSVFHGLKLKNLKFLNCICKEVDFQEADLTDASFEGTDLEKSLFSHTNLTNTNFASATNYWIDARNNTLKRATFTLPEALSLLKPFDITLADPKIS
jgi:fluoroquinolone resistance protein